jgi:hypothetical protein
MAANPPVQFARTPAFANNCAIIDYTTREGHNLYYKNIRGFYGATDTDKFNSQPEGLKGFFNEMIQRVDEADWMDLFMVPLDNEDVDGETLFFLKHYGMFTLAALTEYIEVHHIGNQDRWEQDNAQAQMCIMNSLSQDAKHRIGVWADDYTIEGEIQALLLLKVIIHDCCRQIASCGALPAPRPQMYSWVQFNGALKMTMAKFRRIQYQIRTMYRTAKYDY